MPALITHHLFGEHAAKALPEGIISEQEDLVAFLVGNQGPDPFFFRWRAPIHVCHNCLTLAQQFHNEHPSTAFAAIREGVSHLQANDTSTGRAFALGMLSHYLLDRTTHPFIYAQQYQIIAANDELKDAGSQVHAIVEGDLDVMMLWHERHEDVRQCPPAANLNHTPRIGSIGGALTSQAAFAAFSREVGQSWYGSCLRDMQTFYRRCEPAGRSLSRVLGSTERCFRSHSQIQAMSHRVVSDATCPWANATHDTWINPFYGTTSNESFLDRFDAALEAWPVLAECFVRGDDLAAITQHLDYSGRDLGALEESVEGKLEPVRPAALGSTRE